METSELTKQRIEELLNKGKRFDNRGLNDFRNLEIDFEISNKAEGSAIAKLGDTQVIAGIKMNVMEPFGDSPDEGVLMVGAELSPLSSDRFEMGPPQIQAIELARIIDRGIRESHCIDMKKLCITPGEKVWCIYVDLYILNADGNLIDASNIAAIAALQTAVFPKLDENKKVLFGDFTKERIPMKSMPITVTSYKIDSKFVIDPVQEEEDCAKARVSVNMVFGEEENIHAMQKAGVEALTEEQIVELMEESSKQGRKLYNAVQAIVNKYNGSKK